MENAVTLKHIAAYIDALMASYAAQRLEKLIAGQLFWRNRAGFTCQPSVEAAARGDEGPLVCRDRIQDSGGVRLLSVGLAELLYHFGVGTQLTRDFVKA